MKYIRVHRRSHTPHNSDLFDVLDVIGCLLDTDDGKTQWSTYCSLPRALKHKCITVNINGRGRNGRLVATKEVCSDIIWSVRNVKEPKKHEVDDRVHLLAHQMRMYELTKQKEELQVIRERRDLLMSLGGLTDNERNQLRLRVLNIGY